MPVKTNNFTEESAGQELVITRIFDALLRVDQGIPRSTE